MKKRTLGKFIGMPLCAVLLLAACGKNTTETDDGSSKEETQETEDPVQDEKTDDGVPETAEPEDGGAVEEVSDAEDLSSQLFSEYISETEKMISEAADQYYAEDYTPLDEPVKYNVLWLGFTHVTYKELDFQMTDDDREYLEAVALNFEKSVESITDHNLDITVDLHFSEDAVELTQWEGADWLYLAQDTVQPVIDQYTAGKEYDTVLTTVQSSGDENYFRNEAIDYYSDNYIMLGLKTSGLSSAMGYSTFDLGQPREGTYPLEDPEIPSLYATAVAVHEWMHQLEDLKTIMGIEYPIADDNPEVFSPSMI